MEKTDITAERVALAFLKSIRQLDATATVLLIFTLSLLGLHMSSWLVLSAISNWLLIFTFSLLIVTKYYGFRLRLDERLFEVLLEEACDVGRFDAALGQLIGKNPELLSRPLPERIIGARRLVRRFVLLLSIACGCLLLALIAGLRVI